MWESITSFHITGHAMVALRIAIILVVTCIVRALFRRSWRRFAKDTIHFKFTQTVLSLVIVVAGTFLALREIPNFENTANALLAGSGIMVLAIGLAAQESLGNAFNGLLLSISRPFEVGDRIHLVNANITGFVENMTIRHTVIRSLTNSRIIIPNTIMNRELIENACYTNPHSAMFIDLIVTYDSDIDQARAIIAAVISAHPLFIDTRTAEQVESGAPLVPVLVRNLGLYGVELRASMWTDTVFTLVAASGDVRLQILHEFKKAGVQIASGTMVGVPTPI
ncbi:MAG: mechanosensitive ion channel family protein [Defluviitaleaceae bacterium]|nr:mechanosensitive ion channel family protein [Defluviitaleaceae bacterium]